MQTLTPILISTIIISLLALIGIITFSIKHKLLEKVLLFLVALSAGTLIGDAFIHLIPQALENSDTINTLLFVLLGFILFFLLEKILHWRHCHKDKCQVHTFAYTNLVGDFFHNFLDGIIIAAAFIISIPVGIASTIAIALHEIPQEISDFGVLVYAGFSRKKALILNFLIALTTILGGIIGFYLIDSINLIIKPVIAIAAGGFIYIAASDLIPELKKDKTFVSILHLIVFVLGISLMYLLLFLE